MAGGGTCTGGLAATGLFGLGPAEGILLQGGAIFWLFGGGGGVFARDECLPFDLGFFGTAGVNACGLLGVDERVGTGTTLRSMSGFGTWRGDGDA